ncbi:uncharacterized protein LTR77_001531 [Saxophila tyrrhenica]|uniref:Uncharacterized protein n=1 Tax=Saxophila tyrrhenica TaxID=1690608 RepID=A0AAV9PL18_9PEZI|nr:hypothetical protein LTR77_001531 [Saxophila tyrrhenica]
MILRRQLRPSASELAPTDPHPTATVIRTPTHPPQNTTIPAKTHPMVILGPPLSTSERPPPTATLQPTQRPPDRLETTRGIATVSLKRPPSPTELSQHTTGRPRVSAQTILSPPKQMVTTRKRLTATHLSLASPSPSAHCSNSHTTPTPTTPPSSTPTATFLSNAKEVHALSLSMIISLIAISLALLTLLLFIAKFLHTYYKKRHRRKRDMRLSQPPTTAAPGEQPYVPQPINRTGPRPVLDERAKDFVMRNVPVQARETHGESEVFKNHRGSLELRYVRPMPDGHWGKDQRFVHGTGEGRKDVFSTEPDRWDREKRERFERVMGTPPSLDQLAGGAGDRQFNGPGTRQPQYDGSNP